MALASRILSGGGMLRKRQTRQDPGHLADPVGGEQLRQVPGIAGDHLGIAESLPEMADEGRILFHQHDPDIAIAGFHQMLGERPRSWPDFEARLSRLEIECLDHRPGEHRAARRNRADLHRILEPAPGKQQHRRCFVETFTQGSGGPALSHLEDLLQRFFTNRRSCMMPNGLSDCVSTSSRRSHTMMAARGNSGRQPISDAAGALTFSMKPMTPWPSLK